MTEQEALIRRVCLTPDEDLPRLIYADWCDGNGQHEYAEFIRVQIELAQCGDDPHKPCGGYYCDTYDDGTTAHRDCRTARLRNREQELKDVLRMPLWVGEQPVQARFFGAITRRGFYESATCTAAQWLAHGPAIVQQQPITRALLSDREPGRLSSDGIDRYYWLPFGDLASVAAEFLPDCIFNHLVRSGALWDTPQAAKAALSAAALLWARQEAGLEVVLCIACGGSGGDRLDCPGCNGTGEEIR